ncbi:hypothetical protein GCM10007388_07590 [Pseudoduganella plicata]|uniref:Ice-binding protein C-terminal domain-containing protein n=2 Tax=Pseudoduganella plicata TaxID=321984 RepID=A0AA87Y4Y2_9BURK|nr:hypothetical protein GCM10007388_07590 [Pseudoduganella plicata]
MSWTPCWRKSKRSQTPGTPFQLTSVFGYDTETKDDLITPRDRGAHDGIGGISPPLFWRGPCLGGPASDVAHVNVSMVPEPETYGMMLAGLLAIGAIARKRAN